MRKIRKYGAEDNDEAALMAAKELARLRGGDATASRCGERHSSMLPWKHGGEIGTRTTPAMDIVPQTYAEACI